MEPHEKMRHLFHNFLRKLFIAVGHDIFRDGPFKPYGFSYAMYLLLAFFFIGVVNTVTQYDMLTVMKDVAFLALALELVVKIQTARYGPDAVNMLNKIYEANAKTGSRKRLLLINRFAFISEIVLKVGVATYYLAGLFYFVSPIHVYVTRNQIEPIFPLYFPFIDENTLAGFAMLNAFHILFLVFATTGTSCTDFLFVSIITNFPVLTTILCDNIDELNDTLGQKKVDTVLARAKFKNILYMHREIWDVIDGLENIFFMICFIQIACAAMSASIELFICLKFEFFPAIGLVFGFLFQIISFCTVGGIVEIYNAQMYESILICDWFLLPIPDQKLYGILLMHVQESKALSIGGLAPLNFDTCVRILKTIYSYIMILYTFIA